MTLVLITLATIAGSALHVVMAGGAVNPPALRWPFVALAALMGAALWSTLRRVEAPAARRARRHTCIALLILTVLVVETEASLFATIAAGSASALASAADRPSVHALALAGALLIAATLALSARALKRTGRLSLTDIAVGVYIAAGLLVSAAVYARGRDVAAAVLPFGDYFAAALIYVPVRLFVRSPAQARLSAAFLLVTAAMLAAAAAPALFAESRARVATSAATVAPARWLPAGWSLRDDASAMKQMKGPRYATRVIAGAGDTDFRFQIPGWFVVPGRRLAATAFIRSESGGHLDLQLFQRERSVHSQRHRIQGDWETLVVEMVADPAPAPVGLDLNLPAKGVAEIDFVTLSSPRGALRVLGANHMIWEPAGWTLLQPDASAARVADGSGERLRLIAGAGGADLRHVMPRGRSAAGRTVAVSAQIYATRPIARLQLIVEDAVVDTAKHRGSGWETLVVTGVPHAAHVAVDVDLEPGEAHLQSVVLDAGGQPATLLGATRDLTTMPAPESAAPRVPDVRRAPSYRERLAAAPAGALTTGLILLAALACAALWEILRRARRAAAPLETTLASAIFVITIGAFAAVMLLPALMHPGFAMTAFGGLAAALALAERGSAR